MAAEEAIAISRMAKAIGSRSQVTRVMTRSHIKNARSMRISSEANKAGRKKAVPASKAKTPGSAGYLKLVEWSEEDGCYIGSAPPIIGPACHGLDEAEVYKELCRIVDEWLEIMEKDGTPVPAQTLRRQYSGRFNLRTGKEWHKALEIRAKTRGESLNAFCVHSLKAAVEQRAKRISGQE